MKACADPDEFGRRQAGQPRPGARPDRRGRGARKSPDWIGLPEVFDFLGGSREEKFAAAEFFREGPAYAMCRELAAKHGVFIHAGSFLEKNPEGKSLSNTTVVFDRKGAEIALYRKIHMFDVTTPDGASYRESALFSTGRASSRPTSARA